MDTHGIGLSDIGRKRKNNEDAFLIDEDLGLYVVCDGLGGHLGGERAATLCIEHVVGAISAWRDGLEAMRVGGNANDHLKLRTLAEDAVRSACKGVHDAATSDPKLSGMGCTLTMLLVAGNKAVMAHVGDTRLYLCRDGAAWQLSTDHTFAEEMVRRGQLTPDAASTHPYSNALSRAIGGQQSVEVETLILDVLPDDTFLICSDGLTEYLEGLAELAAIVNDEKIEDAPRVLIDLANERGGHDNVTAVLVQVTATDAEQQEARELAEEVRAGVNAIRAVEIFEKLRFADLLRVFLLAKPRQCNPGDEVLKAGRDEGLLCIVLTEGLELVGPGDVVSQLQAGDSIGAPNLLIDRSCRSTLRARSESRVLTISGRDFRRLAKRRPFLGVSVLFALASKLDTELAATGEQIIDEVPHADRTWWKPLSWF